MEKNREGSQNGFLICSCMGGKSNLCHCQVRQVLALSLKKYLGEAINENEKVIISNKFKFVFLIFLT